MFAAITPSDQLMRCMSRATAVTIEGGIARISMAWTTAIEKNERSNQRAFLCHRSSTWTIVVATRLRERVGREVFVERQAPAREGLQSEHTMALGCNIKRR
jgi:hypothetical protein